MISASPSALSGRGGRRGRSMPSSIFGRSLLDCSERLDEVTAEPVADETLEEIESEDAEWVVAEPWRSLKKPMIFAE